MDLKDAVEKYLETVKEFRQPMPMSHFGLSRKETEAMISAWDEDYHLHRHFELIPPAAAQQAAPEAASTYLINGLPYSSIVFKESIRHVLA